MADQLSPAAQSILDAADKAIQEWPPSWEAALAAALRAAADQMSYAGAEEAAIWLTKIAAELEGAQ